MRESISVTMLRANIYKIVDEVLKTGVPVSIHRNGQTLKIVPEQKKRKLDNLKKRKGLKCSAEELINISWESEWNADDVC